MKIRENGIEISAKWDEENEDEIDIPIGNTDVVEFLLKKSGDEFLIEFGIHFGGSCAHPPGVEASDTGIFTDYMQKFINQFIK